jgi:NAD(P)-dependent dehydrogenase (short-subunit alcohol dehydrogenase family)
VRTTLITGAASGFGREVARLLVGRGEQVVLLDVNDADGKAVAEELGAPYLHCDVSDYDEVLATTAEAEQIAGGLDAFFLNAGISSGFSFGPDFDLAKYRRAMGINVDGVVFGVQAALPVLQRRGGGSIVCTASMAGLTGTPFDPIYGTNKHAVVGLVRALGPALQPQGISINVFCPGFAETKIITDIRDHLTGVGVPIIPVEKAAASVLQIFDSGLTGEAWLLQAGRDVMPYKFRGIPGPLSDEGDPAGVLDPTDVPGL